MRHLKYNPQERLILINCISPYPFHLDWRTLTKPFCLFLAHWSVYKLWFTSIISFLNLKWMLCIYYINIQIWFMCSSYACLFCLWTYEIFNTYLYILLWISCIEYTPACLLQYFFTTSVNCGGCVLYSRGFSRQEYWIGLTCLPPGDLPNPGIEPRSPTLQADSLLTKPPWKPKNTGVSSLSLLQGIFLTQESNWGLLHCRWILYQLSHQGSPSLWDI